MPRIRRESKGGMKTCPTHVTSTLDPAGIGGCYDHHGALSTTNTTKVPVCTGPGEMTLAVQNNHIPSTVETVTPVSRAEAI
jgi:hypothetical protein